MPTKYSDTQLQDINRLAGRISHDEVWQVKPIHLLPDDLALQKAETFYEQAVGAKRAGLERFYRYRNIFEALNPPEEILDEDSGLAEDDESRYSNTYLPVGAAIAESGRAKLFNMFFSTEDYFQIEADDIEDTFFASEITAHQKKRHREMKFKNKVFDALGWASCFDYGVTMTRWLLEPGYAPKRRKIITSKDYAGMTLQEQKVFMEMQWIPDKVDRSDVIVLPYNRCFHDWTATSLEDSQGFCFERDVSIGELLENSVAKRPGWGRYKNVEKIAAGAILNLREQVSSISDPTVRQAINNTRVTVVTFISKHHMIEFSQGFILRRMNLCGWPLQLWKIFRTPGKFEGMGFLQRIERNQYDINAAMNSRRDFQNLVSNPIGAIDADLLGEQEGAFRMHPGFLGVSNGGNVRDKLYIHQPGGNTNQDSMQDISSETSAMERMSGVNESTQGMISSGRTTATEIREATAGSVGRLATIARLIEEEALESIYLNLFMLEQMNLTKEEAFQYAGQEGESQFAIDPSSYYWNSVPRFSAKGALAVQDTIQTEQFLHMIDRAMTMPMVKWNWNNLAIEMVRRLHPHEYSKFIDDPNVPDHNVPPEQENELIASGRHVEISPVNNHSQHLQGHEAVKMTADFKLWPVQRQLMLQQHIDQHKQALQGMASAMAGARQPQQQQEQPAMQDSADPMRGMRPGTVAA